MSLKLVFMGSPDFAVPALTALHDAGHRIAAVYCQPPRPAGRGLALRPCAVQLAAERLGLPIRSPASLRRDPAIAAEFASLDADVAVVAAYGLILPQQMLDAPRRSCINIHASLLPRWRGAAPIQAAILAGDAQAGVTIMQMQAGLDTGPMLLAEAIPLDARSTTPWLHDRLAEIGARLVLRALAEPPAPTPQSDEGVTYAPRLTREDGRIDWSRPAAEIDRRFRALTPWPGLFTMLDGQVLKVLGLERLSDPPSSAARPGTTLDAALGVRCGAGAIRLTRIQNPGRAAMDASAFLRGRSVPAGTSLA